MTRDYLTEFKALSISYFINGETVSRFKQTNSRCFVQFSSVRSTGFGRKEGRKVNGTLNTF